jgi:purine nucleoside phosphorylase
MKGVIPAIGVIGGSGLYQLEELRDKTTHQIDTPFGPPSDALVGGKIAGRQVYFLPRHGREHGILPHELNHRANIYALRSLNVRWIISVSAVGSLQEKYAPRDILLPSQFYDQGFDVIGMTNLPEAKLAREAEIALATMAMITDYDCWRVEEEPVSAQTVLGYLLANADTAGRVIVNVIPRLPEQPNWPEHSALDSAFVTETKLWPPATVDRLRPILARFL